MAVTKKSIVKEPVVVAPVVEAPKEKVPAVVEPEVVAPVAEQSIVGLLGGKVIIKSGKKVVNGKTYNELVCEDLSTYLLSDSDVATQVKLK
jgi:hypothetical protein